MTYDGKILALARATIEQKRLANEAEHARRQDEAYAVIPELRQIDLDTAHLMASIATKALSGGNMKDAVDSVRSKTEALAAKRAALLRENGLPENYTDEIYSCPDCRDTGYVLGKMCCCLKDIYKSEAVRDLSSHLDFGGQSFEKFDLSLYPAGGERVVMSETYNFCRKYAEEFKDASPNLLFRGGTGLGKTFLSACIARVVSEKGFSVVYDTAVSVLDAFEAQKFGRGDIEESSSKIRRYLGCDLLILDDLGTEMATSFSVTALYSLINSRLMSGVKTIISTNLSPEEMRSRYSSAIFSRLEGEYIIQRFVGDDIRLKRREG